MSDPHEGCAWGAACPFHHFGFWLPDGSPARYSSRIPGWEGWLIASRLRHTALLYQRAAARARLPLN